MIPERRTKPATYAAALSTPVVWTPKTPKTPEVQAESPYHGTLNSTPMRVARGGSSAEAAAVGAPAAVEASPLVKQPLARAGGGSKAVKPADSVVLVSSDSSQSDGWQTVVRRSKRVAERDGNDGNREPSPPAPSQKKKRGKAPSSVPVWGLKAVLGIIYRVIKTALLHARWLS